MPSVPTFGAHPSRSRLRGALKRSAVFLFKGADKLGAHVLPKHYYTSIPDYSWLTKNRAVWCRKADLSGLKWDIDEQLEWLTATCAPFYHEAQGLATYSWAESRGFGPGYGPIESQVLHCVCRSVKPARYIEVGSGVSTACAIKAFERNAVEGTEPTVVTCIEPFPSPALTTLGEITLRRTRVQQLPLEFFDQLERGDILFIDSTHTVKLGSDVVFLMIEVLPRLKPGVLVHIHDVFLPYLYQRDALDSLYDWQETTLLLALLKGNPSLQIRCCLSALHYAVPKELQTLLNDYCPQEDTAPGLAQPTAQAHFPSSIWLQVAG